MSKVTKNSINHNQVDFNATALDSNPLKAIQLTDTVEFYYATGELAASVRVGKVIDFIEKHNLHVPEDKEAFECDALEYFDQQFEEVTAQYFMSELALGKELGHAA